jgi:AraC-like DNA-binding protein
MSVRTLQRRLATANTSFQQLLRGVLRQSADEYLTDGRLSQSEIASFWDIRRRARSAAPIDLGQV